MNKHSQPLKPATRAFSSVFPLGMMLLMLGSPILQAAPCRPCGARCAPKGQHPCAANPCAAKNPCAANPCSANPCAANPCAAKPNPCAAKAVSRPENYAPYQGDTSELMRMGKQLYNDTTLSSNNLSCASCHGDESKPSMFQHTFTQAYPHPVAMATNQFGMDQVYLDEMIQICMVAPMASNPLPWESMELAALTAYVGSLQASYAPNPCAANPCVANNPCAANPCAANPCAASNPCTANPCAAKNPCSARNPCAAKRAPCAAI